MRMATIVSLGASAALGLAALFVARTMAPHPTAAQAAAPVPVGVPVVVAKGGIAYGKRVEASDLMVARLPKDAVPAGAFSSVEQVMGRDGGGAPVTLAAIAAKEPLLPAKLSGPGERATVAAAINPGMRAYTIGVNEVAGGGGHVLPGDRVDVLLARPMTGGGEDQGKRMRSDIVIQNVRVLGMDLDADPATDKPFTAKTATLEVSVPDAQKLALAGESGTLSLVLRRPGDADVAPSRMMQIGDIGGGAAALSGAPRTRPARPSAPAVHRAPAPSGATVMVMQGDKGEAATVPRDRW